MTVAVRMFARLREIAGTDVVAVSVPPGATADDVRRAVESTWPDAGGMLAKSAIAVNNDYAEPDRPICPGDEVAIIPPVSGGSRPS